MKCDDVVKIGLEADFSLYPNILQGCVKAEEVTFHSLFLRPSVDLIRRNEEISMMQYDLMPGTSGSRSVPPRLRNSASRSLLMPAMNTGIVYVAFGGKHVREANESAKSLRAFLSRNPVMLFTDAPHEAVGFDEVVPVEGGHRNRLDKIECMSQAPYDRVLFLDTDTYICADISDLFELLDRFDIAMAHAPRRIHHRYPSLDVPDSFPEFNSGVMVFRNTPAVQAMFALWEQLYVEALASDWFATLKEQRGHITLQDQHFLRKALYDTDLRIATLPYEYNCRMVPGIVNGEVKVLHGRHIDLAGTAAQINAHLHKRLFTPSKTSLYTVGARQSIIVPYLAVVTKAIAGRDRVLKMIRSLRTSLGL